MRQFPAEFSDLLSPAGHRLLAGRHASAGGLADPRCRFLAFGDLLDTRRVNGAAALLERALGPHMRVMAQPIPPETIWDLKQNYAERLPKTMRQRSLHLDGARTAGRRAAEAIGLSAMLTSESYRAFAAALAGRPLKRRHGLQAIVYGPGDYAGPHNDHHPEEPTARQGYLDVHLGFCSAGVRSQLLVYAKAGHFTESVEVGRPAMVTAYRLPFWHYTTPLLPKRGREAEARRWLLLGTFLFADQGAR